MTSVIISISMLDEYFHNYVMIFNKKKNRFAITSKKARNSLHAIVIVFFLLSSAYDSGRVKFRIFCEVLANQSSTDTIFLLSKDNLIVKIPRVRIPICWAISYF